MTKSQKEPLEEFIPKIERAFHILRRTSARTQAQELNLPEELLQEHTPQQPNMENKEAQPEAPKSLREYATPTFIGVESSILRPGVNANKFKIKLDVITMIQSNQFGGLPLEDPNVHLRKFLKICDTF